MIREMAGMYAKAGVGVLVPFMVAWVLVGYETAHALLGLFGVVLCLYIMVLCVRLARQLR